jgi:TolB protein
VVGCAGNAAMVAFGALSATMGGWRCTAGCSTRRNTANPQVLGKQYNEAASEDMARTVAHRFADEIIYRLGGGINGIAETRIYFVSTRSGSKEIWAMDYDGQNQHQITHLGSISLSPRISPDNSRIAFSSLGKRWMGDSHVFAGPGPHGEFSREARREAAIFLRHGLQTDRRSRSRRRDRETRRFGWRTRAEATAQGHLAAGPNVAPVWNPRTNAQLAFVAGAPASRRSTPWIRTARNVQRMTDSGYAVSPSWAPNGGLLAFSWNRKYGPGDPGGQDIYVFEIASMHWLQVTHESGSNDFPSWAPDGRHIVFQRSIGHRTQIWTMLADGTHQQQLTRRRQLDAELELEVRCWNDRGARESRITGANGLKPGEAGSIEYRMDYDFSVTEIPPALLPEDEALVR